MYSTLIKPRTNTWAGSVGLGVGGLVRLGPLVKTCFVFRRGPPVNIDVSRTPCLIFALPPAVGGIPPTPRPGMFEHSYPKLDTIR